MIELPTQCISRSFVLPLAAFDYFKRYQQALASRTGQQYDNSQTLTKLIAEHIAHVGLTGKPTTAPKAALLSTREGNKEGQ